MQCRAEMTARLHKGIREVISSSQLQSPSDFTLVLMVQSGSICFKQPDVGRNKKGTTGIQSFPGSLTPLPICLHLVGTDVCILGGFVPANCIIMEEGEDKCPCG